MVIVVAPDFFKGQAEGLGYVSFYGLGCSMPVDHYADCCRVNADLLSHIFDSQTSLVKKPPTYLFWGQHFIHLFCFPF